MISDSEMNCLEVVVMALVILLTVLHLHDGFIIDRSNLNLTTVPQNVDSRLATLKLDINFIEEINNTSFPQFTKLCCLHMKRNPLKYIKENTFQNNPRLHFFACSHCDIKTLPTSFGPCTSSFKTFTLMNGINPNAVDAIFRYPYFRAFASLRVIELSRLPLKNMANLKLSPSTEHIRVVSADVAVFPNLTSSNFPKLTYMNIQGNPINIIPDDVWQHVTDNLQTLDVSQTGLSVMVDLTLRPNLQEIYISNNHLETIPDLLNMTSLTTLNIGGNSRMSCDHRMCWRRLWDRIREPLASYDDVTCIQPSKIAGYKLSVVNPELMDCAKGIIFYIVFELDQQRIIILIVIVTAAAVVLEISNCNPRSHSCLIANVILHWFSLK